MRAFFVTEGGKDIGFGHLNRCLSLCLELERRGFEVVFVVNKDISALNRLKSKDVKTYSNNNIMEVFGFIKGSDLAVIDSYKLRIEDYKRIGEVVRLLACIDDNKRIDYPPGIVTNGALNAENIDYKESGDIAYLLGAKFALVRPEFVDPEPKRIRKKIQKVLITFGGDDSKSMTAVVRDFLLKKMPDILFDIVIGGSFKNKEEFKNSVQQVCYHSDVGAVDMIKLMRAADIAISAGGQTLYELAMTGTPTIGICVADNQTNNLKAWGESGFVKNCGWYNEASLLKNIASSIDILMPESKRESVSEIGQRIVDGKGAARVSDEIMEMLK